jgi:hypothetical protein
MDGYKNHIFILDRCSTVIRWDPVAGTAIELKMEDRPAEAFQLTVSSQRIAILDDDRKTVWLYGMTGKLLTKHQYVGESFFTRISLTEDTVAGSSYYDKHYLRLYHEGIQDPITLVENPRYWPDSSPRYTSFVEVCARQGKHYAFDLTDFTLYQVDAKTHSITTIRKDKHPRYQPLLKPESFWGAEGSHYTGGMMAVDATLNEGYLYVLMIDRSLGPNAQPGDGYLELAASKIQEKTWHTLVRLDDPQRFGGSKGLTVVGSSAYLYRPDGSIYAVHLPSH